MPGQEIRVHRTPDEELVESLVPDHRHLTQPTAGAEAKQFLLASIGKQLVATAWVRPISAWLGAFGGLYVLPERRERGVGGCLMDAGLGELAAGGARVAMLGVHLDNEEGLALARSRGFRTVSFVPGRRTPVGGLLGGLLGRLSPLPYPDSSTRMMAVWLDEDQKAARAESERVKSGSDGTGSSPGAGEPTEAAPPYRRT